MHTRSSLTFFTRHVRTCVVLGIVSAAAVSGHVLADPLQQPTRGGRTCDGSSPAAKTLGRTHAGSAAPGHPAGWTICDSARDARARNSPAAPNLEAQCARLPTKALGRVSADAPSAPAPTGKALGRAPAGTPSSPPAPEQTICDAAQDARARDLPDAGDLEAQCLADSLPSGGEPDASQASLPEDASDAGNAPEVYDSDYTESDAAPYETADAVAGRHPRGAPRRPDIDDGSNDPNSNPSDARDDLQTPSQPANSIRVEVSYPIAYGYQSTAGDFAPEPNSCGAFYVSAVPATRTRMRRLQRIDTQPHMRSSDGMYVCEYLIRDQPLNQPIAVRVAMADPRAAGSDAWRDGDESRPAAGQRRMITDGEREVVLTADEARTSLRFEMAYSRAR